jgi:glycosyltransferase involved in cell wall biosynthesis
MISLVIPTYNGQRYLGQTLDSVFVQTRRPDEILIVDDASTDGTPDVVERLARTSPIAIRFFRLEHNSGGPAQPMNVGIQAARGDLIALLDQDDLMLPEKVALQSGVLAAHPEVDLVLSDYALFNAEGPLPASRAQDLHAEGHRVLMQAAPLEGQLRLVDRALAGAALLVRPGLPLTCSNQFFRKSLWERLGGFDAASSLSADYTFVLNAMGPPLAWLDRVLIHKRVHDRNFWKPTLRNLLGIYIAREQWLREHRDWIDAALADRVRADDLQQFLETARIAYWQRDWLTFRQARSCLHGFPESAEAAALLRRRVYPQWFYRVKDRLDHLVRRAARHVPEPAGNEPVE